MVTMVTTVTTVLLEVSRLQFDSIFPNVSDILAVSGVAQSLDHWLPRWPRCCLCRGNVNLRAGQAVESEVETWN